MDVIFRTWDFISNINQCNRQKGTIIKSILTNHQMLRTEIMTKQYRKVPFSTPNSSKVAENGRIQARKYPFAACFHDRRNRRRENRKAYTKCVHSSYFGAKYPMMDGFPVIDRIKIAMNEHVRPSFLDSIARGSITECTPSTDPSLGVLPYTPARNFKLSRETASSKQRPKRAAGPESPVGNGVSGRVQNVKTVRSCGLLTQ